MQRHVFSHLLLAQSLSRSVSACRPATSRQRSCSSHRRTWQLACDCKIKQALLQNSKFKPAARCCSKWHGLASRIPRSVLAAGLGLFLGGLLFGFARPLLRASFAATVLAIASGRLRRLGLASDACILGLAQFDTCGFIRQRLGQGFIHRRARRLRTHVQASQDRRRGLGNLEGAGARRRNVSRQLGSNAAVATQQHAARGSICTNLWKVGCVTTAPRPMLS